MNTEYASVSSRIKAALIDGVVLILLIYSITELLLLFDSVSNGIRIALFIIIFVLYEPLSVSVFGGTVGHFFNDIVVKKDSDETQNINFFMALIRFILKYLLGWISLITISGNEKRKAIHDFAVNSIVRPFKIK